MVIERNGCRAGGRILSAALVVLAVTLAGCGGSSSESPWPVEPIDTEPGPAGEDLTRGNVIATEDLPNNYGQGGGAASDDSSDVETDDE